LLNVPETELKAIVQSLVESRESQETKSFVEVDMLSEEPLPAPQPDILPVGEPSDALIAEDLSKLDRKTLIELIPAEIKDTIDPDELRKLSKKELISLLESFIEPE
jgi:hypothetical protein